MNNYVLLQSTTGQRDYGMIGRSVMRGVVAATLVSSDSGEESEHLGDKVVSDTTPFSLLQS